MWNDSLLCGLVLVITAAPAVAQSARPIIQLDNTFGEDRAWLQIVANQVYATVLQWTHANPPKRQIQCFIDGARENPGTTFNDPSKIDIHLLKSNGQNGRYYCPYFVYQLSHELAHVMVDPHIGATNGLIETVAVALSHQVLDGIASRPPGPLCDADELRGYAERADQRYLSNFPDPVSKAVGQLQKEDLNRGGRSSFSGPVVKARHDVSLYLRYRRDDQERELDRGEYNLATLGAIRLGFEKIPWESIAGLAELTTKPLRRNARGVVVVDLDQDMLLSNRPRLADCLCHLGRGCRTGFIAAAFDAPAPVQGGFGFEESRRWIWLVDFAPSNREQMKREVESRGGKIFLTQ